ncbi:hypothetical protein [Rickettsia endosymbiont of Nabis limbatus]|uniref:hypothetical protein n=1 Tax=Rickettsia endosymbiont of Nabis limbatus TaxID=3066268 RepID=UPI003AF3DA15
MTCLIILTIIYHSSTHSVSFVEEIDNKIEELFKEAIAELGFSNTEKDSEEEIDLSKDQEQKVVEFIVNKEIAKEENTKHLWMAINDINLTKINELENNIDGKEYAEILITSLLLNSIIRNNKVIKFLLTEIEISQYPTLKATIIPDFLEPVLKRYKK